MKLHKEKVVLYLKVLSTYSFWYISNEIQHYTVYLFPLHLVGNIYLYIYLFNCNWVFTRWQWFWHVYKELKFKRLNFIGRATWEACSMYSKGIFLRCTDPWNFTFHIFAASSCRNTVKCSGCRLSQLVFEPCPQHRAAANERLWLLLRMREVPDRDLGRESCHCGGGFASPLPNVAKTPQIRPR